MSEEWTKWTPHDGKHLPPDGAIVQAEFDDDTVLTGVMSHADETHLKAFLWAEEPDVSHVMAYRIRKPKGLSLLQSIAAQPSRYRVEELV